MRIATQHSAAYAAGYDNIFGNCQASSRETAAMTIERPAPAVKPQAAAKPQASELPVDENGMIDLTHLLNSVLVATQAEQAAKRAAAMPIVRDEPAAPTAAIVQPQQLQAAQRSNFGGSSKQKLRCVGIGPSRYAFGYLGRKCETGLEGNAWYLAINGTRSRKMFKTKRHAVNYARVVIDAGKDQWPLAAPTIAAPVVATIKPVVVEQPKPVVVQVVVPQPAPAAKLPWQNPTAAWRKEASTGRQSRMVGHLCGKLAKAGMPSNYSLAGFNRGQVSDLIDTLKLKLGQSPRASDRSLVVDVWFAA